MCPPAPVPPMLDFNSCSNDEDFITYLGGRKIGDPIPDNVITDVNPFSIKPWHSPENVWYMYNSEDQHSLSIENGENRINVSDNGYWRSLDALRIFNSTTAMGTKITLEFYEGKAPFGERTGWRMHEYQAEPNSGGAKTSQDYSSLSRFFLQTDQLPTYDEQHISLAAAGDGHCSEPYLAEQERNDLFSLAASENSQMAALNEVEGKSADGPCNEQRTDNSAEDMHDLFDFSEEDYLELNDLLDQEPPSASSSSSGRSSLNSYDYFNAGALLQDLGNQSSHSLEEEHTVCKFNISAPVKSNLLVLRPEHDSTQDLHSGVVVAGSIHENPVQCNRSGLRRVRSSPIGELWEGTDASIPSSSQGNQEIHTNSGSPNGSKDSPRRRGLRPVCRLAKLGKKYCCWGSF